MADLSGLYPQPPQQNQNLFTGDPLRLLDAIGKVNALQKFQSEQGALGAYRNALGPNGADPDALARGLKQSGATFGAPEVMGAALQQQGTAIENQRLQLALGAGQSDFIRSRIASLANSPNVTKEDIFNLIPEISRVVDPGHTSSAMINSVMKSVIDDPQGIKHGLITLQNLMLGGNAAQRVEGPPDISGAPTKMPLGAAGYGAPQAVGAPQRPTSQTMPVGLPPGQPEYLAQSQAAGTSLLHSVQDIPNQKALLENIDALGREATSGPSADFEQRLNALALRWLGHGITLTPGETAAGEGYNKLVNQIATAQATATHATDSYLQSAFHANPNLSLSKQGREAMIPILKGNLDAQTFKANAFQQFMAGQEKDENGKVDGKLHNANEYFDWSTKFNKTLNPRVFQLQNMTGDQQAEYLRLLTPAERRQLLASYKLYESKGWIPARQQQ